MDIFEHIKKEHREVEGMLQTLSNGYNEQIFQKMRLSLTAHMDAEEASLYPAMKGQAGDMVQHAQEEHDEIREMLGDMGKEDFSSKLSELTEIINDHVQEEENEMFPKAQDMFDQDKIKSLSQEFDEVDERVTQKAR